MKIRDWSVRNFKALSYGELDLSPGVVNVVTGQNSSGKSSLIQSLLAVTQSRGQNGTIILNGPLVRLGTFKDTVRTGNQVFSYSIVAETNERTNFRFDLKVGAKDNRESSLKEDPVLKEVRIVECDSKNQDCSPALSLAVSESKQYKAKDISAIRKSSQYRHSAILRIEDVIDESVTVPPRLYVEFVGIEAKAMHLFGTTATLETLFKKHYKASLSAMASGSAADRRGIASTSFYIRHFAEDSEDISQAYERFLELSDNSQGQPKAPLARATNVLAERLAKQQAANATDQRISVVIPDETLDFFTFSFANGFNSAADYLQSNFPRSLEALSSLNRATKYLSAKVCYLGPLRDEPRILWSHTSQQSPNLPVGARGEYSAYVLNRSGHEEVTYRDNEGETRKESFSVAVSYWLKQLGVASGVSVKPEANLGLRLGVKVGEVERDLTAVGVGVSQVLPVVAGLLRTPPGGCFITEQPELHLHPATQAALADFLITARPDVCVVVETHSEAIVTRVRRRTAEAKVGIEGINLIFIEPIGDVEQSEVGVHTRRVEISNDGNIAEWPAGFLDDGADLRSILRIQAAKARGADW